MLRFKYKYIEIIHCDKPPQDVWYHYFNQKDETKDCYHQDNCDVPVDDENIFIFDCTFTSLLKSAIRIEDKMPKFLHSFCFFDSCGNTINQHGGVIYYYCQGPIVQDRFCSINATIDFVRDYFGIHSYINLRSGISEHNNIIAESCVTQCGSEKQQNTLVADGGKCGIFSSNVSKNSAKINSGFIVVNHNEFCIINFSTFESNFASLYYCLWHDYSSSCPHHDIFCNVVNNSQGEDRYGCIYTNSELIVENCAVLGDYGIGKPFSIAGDNAKLKIINCKLDKLEVSESQGAYTASNSILKKLKQTFFFIFLR